MTTKVKRLSPAQRRMLEHLRDGWRLSHYATSSRSGSWAWSFSNPSSHAWGRVNRATVENLEADGLIYRPGDGWNLSYTYLITDAGRAALAPAGTTSEPRGGEPPAAEAPDKPVKALQGLSIRQRSD